MWYLRLSHNIACMLPITIGNREGGGIGNTVHIYGVHALHSDMTLSKFMNHTISLHQQMLRLLSRETLDAPLVELPEALSLSQATEHPSPPYLHTLPPSHATVYCASSNIDYIKFRKNIFIIVCYVCYIQICLNVKVIVDDCIAAAVQEVHLN